MQVESFSRCRNKQSHMLVIWETSAGLSHPWILYSEMSWAQFDIDLQKEGEERL